MKKKKFSIMLSIATLCLCVAVLAFGVYAAKKASLTTTGSINFEAHNCKVRVLGSVTGAVDNTGAEKTVDKLKDTENDSDGNEQGKLITGDVTWAVGDIYFDDLNCSNDEIATPIVFTFKMTNKSDYAVTADLNLTGDLKTKIKSTVTFAAETDSETVTSSGFVCVLNKDQTVIATLSLILAIDDGFSNVDLNNLNLKFEKPQTETSYTRFMFTKNESNKTASVVMTSWSGEIVVPSSFIDSLGDVYIVSDWGDHSSKMISGISKLTFPNSITSLAFRGAGGSGWSVTEIVLPCSLTSLGDSSFYNVSISTMNLPANLTNIGDVALGTYTSYTIVLPAGVTYIGKNAFTVYIPREQISYQGTMAQWAKITLHADGIGASSVVCSDGTVTL